MSDTRAQIDGVLDHIDAKLETIDEQCAALRAALAREKQRADEAVGLLKRCTIELCYANSGGEVRLESTEGEACIDSVERFLGSKVETWPEIDKGCVGPFATLTECVKQRDAAVARADRLEKAIRDAPHTLDCDSWNYQRGHDTGRPCYCWKSDALAPEHNDTGAEAPKEK